MNETSVEDRIRALPLPTVRDEFDTRVQAVFVNRRRSRRTALAAVALAANVAGILIGWNAHDISGDPDHRSSKSGAPVTPTEQPVVLAVNRDHLLAICTPTHQSFDTFIDTSPELVINYSFSQETHK